MNIWDGTCEFVAVAETESFTAASKQLHISVAQVSRQVSALEKHLKIKLLHRTTRKVSLTESGNIYYQRCKQVLDDLREAQDLTSHLHNKPSGNIRITAPVTYGEEVIAPVIHDFLLAYPDITIQLDLSNQRVDILNDGYDVAFRLGQLEDSKFIARKLTSRKLYTCASPRYIKNNGHPSSVKDLQEYNCLVGTADFWRFQIKGKSQHIRVNGNLRCNSGHSLTNAALKNLGLIQLPDYYVHRYIDSGELVTVLDEFQEANEGVWALYPDKLYLPFKIKTLIDYAIDYLQ